MAEIAGGAKVYLDRAPLKYEGLAPWEVFLSEAQERMTIIIPPEDLEKILRPGQGALGRSDRSGRIYRQRSHRTFLRRESGRVSGSVLSP